MQSLVSEASPEHSAPPLRGAGFVQVLVLVWIPVSHSAVHSVQAPNSAQLPSRSDAEIDKFLEQNLNLNSYYFPLAHNTTGRDVIFIPDSKFMIN